MAELNPHRFDIREPAAFTAAEIAAFCDIVRKGDEVEENGLEERVRAAKALVFLFIAHDIGGVAAIKHPTAGYREGVFMKAGVSDAAHAFGLELGWIFVPEPYRNKKHSLALCNAALHESSGAALFATTRANNAAMQKTLERASFMRLGHAWRSSRGEHDLVLYVASDNI